MSDKCKYCGDPVYKQNRCHKHYHNMLQLQAGARASNARKALETPASRIKQLRDERGMSLHEAVNFDQFDQLKRQTMNANTVHELRSIVYSLICKMENGR